MIPKAIFMCESSYVTINTHADVKAGADTTLSQLLWRMKCAEDFNQWR